MTDVVLALNVGSSSIKFAAYQIAPASLALLAGGQIHSLGGAARFSARMADGAAEDHAVEGFFGAPVDHEAALRAVMNWLGRIQEGCRVVAVGHRIVHGGADYAEPMLIDEAMLVTLKRFIPLAPLHQPHNLEGVAAARRAFPEAAQVGCFDTAFHRSHSSVADTYALPKRFYDEGVRRYGFHGLAYESVARRLAEMAPSIAAGRVIALHLGNGASACAMREGRAVDSTLGFTALDGLPMGSRCGQIDPGVLLYLMTEKGMSAETISGLLYNESGLKGLSGLSNDMRTLEASDDPAARAAIEYFVARLKREIGGLAAMLGGVDALAFTGGIGEHSSRLREAVLTGCEWLGVTLDRQANQRDAGIISAASSRVAVFVLAVDEERIISEHAARVAGFGG